MFFKRPNRKLIIKLINLNLALAAAPSKTKNVRSEIRISKDRRRKGWQLLLPGRELDWEICHNNVYHFLWGTWGRASHLPQHERSLTFLPLSPKTLYKIT